MMRIRVGAQCHPRFVLLAAFLDELLRSFRHEAGGVELLLIGCFINLPPLFAALMARSRVIVGREKIFTSSAALKRPM